MSETAFDAWFTEQEGFSLRAERFDGDVAWLRAAFEAGAESVLASIDAYDAATKSLPLGHEMPTRGASTYNWRRSVVDEIRASIRSPDTIGDRSKI